MIDKPTTKEVARFLSHVQITKHCWTWTAYKLKGGYGRLTFHSKKYIAHRFSYELFVGPIEPGKHILHRRECGRRDCVNPNHLYMGTNDDNMRDKILWGNHRFGETHPAAKLSEKDVLEIRRIHNNKRFGYKDTSDVFGVHRSLIKDIVLGKCWKHLPL